MENIINIEKEAWKKVLGIEVEIKPLPAFITPEVIKKLKGLGFELRYIPKLNIGTINDLREKGVEYFLIDLEQKYPGWRWFEGLSDSQKKDHSVTRNLEQKYWECVLKGNVEFPELPGIWVAVEIMQHTFCQKNPVTEILRIDYRFEESWLNAYRAIQDHKGELLNRVGLKISMDVRMFGALEWNLVANRQSWDIMEWTSTEYRFYNAPFKENCNWRVLIGRSWDGGAAYFSQGNIVLSLDGVGFRVVIVIG